MRINVGKDFSTEPAGRFRTDGPFSGEAFRDDILLPAIRKSEKTVIELDDTEGYGSSFLEEAFGGLVRIHKMSAAYILARIKFVTIEKLLKAEIEHYIKSAAPE